MLALRIFLDNSRCTHTRGHWLTQYDVGRKVLPIVARPGGDTLRPSGARHCESVCRAYLSRNVRQVESAQTFLGQKVPVIRRRSRIHGEFRLQALQVVPTLMITDRDVMYYTA
jgi:hypothetical protein